MYRFFVRYRVQYFHGRIEILCGDIIEDIENVAFCRVLGGYKIMKARKE